MTMRFNNVARLCVLICMCLRGSLSLAQAFLYPGVEPSTEAGLSQTNTRGAVAAMYNPANVIVSKFIEPYADISLLNMTYTYTRSGYDPTVVKVTAPPIAFGLSARPMPKFAVGLLVVPRPALSAQQVNNIPFDQDGQVTVMNADSKQSSILTGLAFSIKPNSQIAFGLGLVEVAEDSSFNASFSDTALTSLNTVTMPPLVQMKYHGSFMQFTLGVRASPVPGLLLGGSYKSATAKVYQGNVSLGGSDPEPVTKVGYLPSVIAMGAEYERGDPTVFGEFRREGWASGAGQVRSGLPGAPQSTALNDVYIIIVGGRYRIGPGQSISGSYGKYPANVGNGTPVSDSSGCAIGGVEFAEFDNLSRNVFAASFKFTHRRGYIQAGFNYTSGSRSVPDGYRGAGSYNLSALTLTTGGTWSF